MGTLWQDMRYGLRMLARQPGFTLIAVLTLALGIGANTAIFSVVNAVLLRPLPYPESERLALLSEYGRNFGEMSISYPNFSDWRAQQTVFEAIGVYNRDSYNLTEQGSEPERIRAAQMSADLFSALRVKPLLGRLYTNDEDKPGAAPVVVLSYGLWQRRFGSDDQIINRSLTFNGRQYTVLGVMPEGFLFPRNVEMWVPVGQLSGEFAWQQRGNHPGLYGVARLKPGVTLAQAQAEFNNISAALARQYPNSNEGNSVRMIPLLENYVSDIRRALWVLLGAVGFVLLIACANVANLLLAQATTRQREMAVRQALGAGRFRLLRQMVTESLLLALVGGGAGVLLAQWGVDLIRRINPDNLPRVREISVDGRVLVFTLAMTLLTGLLFGLMPALQAGRVNLNETLKEAGRGSTGTRHLLRSSLVVAEVALTLVLLVGAGLLLRSFYQLQRVHPGFNTDHLLSFNVALPERRYATPDQQSDFALRLLERLRALPGVTQAAVSSGLPLGNNGWQTSFTIEGRPIPPPSEVPSMEACAVSPGYFEAMNIPLRAGRYFTAQDNVQHLAGRNLNGLNEAERIMARLNVIVIDEDFAHRYWPNENAVGRRIRLGSNPTDPLLTVIGVVGRVRMDGLRQDSGRVQGYFSAIQLPPGNLTVLLKGAPEPETLTAAARAQVLAIDPQQPIYGIQTMDELRAESIAPDRLNMTLLGIFAAVALALALVGIYGVMSYTVTQRTHELGIRLALGAQTRDVVKLVISQGLQLALTGVGIGLVTAFSLTRMMKSLLFGVSATDPLTYAALAMLLITVALAACWIPARRATKVDPLIALRCE
ncbi:MAG: ABC transporter permease [Blastocatellia bacterium]